MKTFVIENFNSFVFGCLDAWDCPLVGIKPADNLVMVTVKPESEELYDDMIAHMEAHPNLYKGVRHVE